MEAKIDTINAEVAYLQIVDGEKIIKTLCLDHKDSKVFRDKLLAALLECKQKQADLDNIKTQLQLTVDAVNATIAKEIIS